MDVFEFFEKLQKFNVDKCPDIAHDLCSILFQHEDAFCWPVLDTSKFSIKGTPVEKEKSIIIAFSGGLKSLATVFHYKSLGYEITLVHFKEKQVPIENISRLAEKLETPLIIRYIEIHNNGK